MKWTFTVNKEPHEAEWQKGAMRCTMPEVIGRVDAIIYAGGLVPCGSAVNLVQPTLETEAGGFAAITLAVQEFADFMSLKMPLSDATVITDVILDDDLEKAKGTPKSFNGNRSEAARYAARVRWGNRQAKTTVPDDGDPIYDPATQLTPAQEAIAAQAEGAVVDARWAKGATVAEQQVNALIAAGFQGNGKPPKPPADQYLPEIDEIVMKSVPDYYLLPKKLQTPDVIDAQEKAFAGIQSLATQYKLGKIDKDTFERGVKDIYGSDDSSRRWDRDASKNPELPTAGVVGRRQKPQVYLDTDHHMDQFPQNARNLGVNPKTGKSYALEEGLEGYDPKTAGKMVGSTYYPTKKQLALRDERIRSVAAKQEAARKASDDYERAVDKWMGVKPMADSPLMTDERKKYIPRNARVAQLLGDANGFHRGAQQVGGDDFDALAKSGRFYVVWRGAGEKNITSLTTTRPDLGGGEQGVGTYTTYFRGRAEGYGAPTPMLIPKTAVRQGRMEVGAWGSQYTDDFTYRHRLNLSHGESDNFQTGDFKVANLSMLIIGPRNHKTKFIRKGYGDWVDEFYERERERLKGGKKR